MSLISGIILGKCWLTGSLYLSDKSFADRRIQYYESLGELDPLRKGQYDEYLKVANEHSGDK